jgi:hypothetical protein
MNAEMPEDFDLVPVALLSIEVGEPIEEVLHRLGEAVQLDDVGMRAVPADVARQFFAELADQAARQQEQSRRLQKMAADTSPVIRGIPRPATADSQMSAFEVMRGVDADAERTDPSRRLSPTEEFLGEVLGPPRKVEVD